MCRVGGMASIWVTFEERQKTGGDLRKSTFGLEIKQEENQYKKSSLRKPGKQQPESKLGAERRKINAEQQIRPKRHGQ